MRIQHGKAIPFLPLVSCFIIGLFTGPRCSEFAADFIYVALLLLATVVLIDRIQGIESKAIFTSVCLCFLLLGVHLSKADGKFRFHYEKSSVRVGKCIEIISQTKKHTGMIVDWQTANRSIGVRSKTTLFNPKTSIHQGDIIVGVVKWHIPKRTRFDGEFDEYTYLKNKGFQGKVSMFGTDVVIIEKGVKPSFITQLKQRVRSVGSRWIKSHDARGLFYALLIGDRTELAKETRIRFADSGIAHVLAVSGLHVGLIFGVLAWLVRKITTRTSYDRILFIVSIPTISIYALITGMGPSVIRAGLMILLFVGLRAAKRKTTGKSILLAVLFGTLIWNPSLRYDIGFQLSFAAVGGILYVYPLMKQMYYPRNNISAKCIDMLYVSLAAQLVTSPITINTFGKFPTYFLLSNLIITPILIIALYIGLGIMIMQWVPSIASLAGEAFEYMIKMSFTLNDHILELPIAVIDSMYLPSRSLPIVCITLVGSLVLLKRQIHLVPWVLVFGLIGLIAAEHSYNRWLSSTEEWIDFPGRKNVLIFRHGSKAGIIYEDSDDPISEYQHQNIERFYACRKLDSGKKSLTKLPNSSTNFKNSIRMSFMSFDCQQNNMTISTQLSERKNDIPQKLYSYISNLRQIEQSNPSVYTPLHWLISSDYDPENVQYTVYEDTHYKTPIHQVHFLRQICVYTLVDCHN